ncbi:L-histidine N(alpha)-methyltransferase [Kordiimonas aestuarii]|uniref:L-histidine N(alpha)-methyltransferase n=1 Tax=Kordiimonas aestuarii TaxID=1005925 RepID=UPI0021D0B2A3|nr:L-histidine N(alpha)-methyltransferase [Kordiimonas aestuarii]
MSQLNPAFKFQDNHPPASDFELEVLEGLAKSPKVLPPKFFYDEVGSGLFDAICRTPEYYPTRTESAIIRDNVDAIARCLGRGCLLVEPGSGNSAKVRDLLAALEPHSYMPMDISKAFLQKEARKLADEFPWLDVYAVCSDFTVSMDIPIYPEGVHRVAFFPGSSIGNFEPGDAAAFMRNIRGMVGDDGGLLIGVDMKKDVGILNAAYNDAAGITAAFNLNLLTRINKKLGADFDLSAFAHHAFYNEGPGRIEMHLRSLADQTVTVAGRAIPFRDGETIHTENSYKYARDEFAALAGDAGFRLDTCWQDAGGLFSLFYFAAR